MVGVTEQAAPSKEALGQLSAAAVDAVSAARQEPAWLHDLRRRAWATFERLPMPTLTTEGWRRTDLRGLRLDEVALPQRHVAVHLLGRERAGLRRGALGGSGQVAGRLVLRDAQPVHGELQAELSEQGLVVQELGEAVRQREALVREYFASVVGLAEDKFGALHGALWNCGVFVYVPAGLSVDLPLHVLQLVTADRLGVFPHVLVVVERDARLVILDEYRSAGRQGQGVATAAVEVVAKPGARVDYVYLQNWGLEQWTFATLRALIYRGAAVRWLTVQLGGAVTKVNLESRLLEPHAETELTGLVFGDGRQHFDHYTLQSHEAADTRSNLLFKAVLQDRASSNYTGLVRIAEEARRCDANQEARNLLLSRGAKADADPRLEILNSDVIRASHGATVGPVDPELLFYVMSRGLSRPAAERLLVEAFFEPVLARVPIKGLRRPLWATIQQRLQAARAQ